MINFCTLFDSNYLTRGLALHESLMEVCPSFHLYVVAFNDDCYNYLQNAEIKNLTPISLHEFEDDKLLSVKQGRSPAEYCWTCTPSIILFCLNTFDLHSCIYIDADMLFYHNPQVLLDEMVSGSILISEHRYSRDYDVSDTHGIYCVQFMYFRNDEIGRNALEWWRDRCIEWCYNFLEDGKFGDQKYLDDWTKRFPGVHVMQHPGGGIAPWNLQQFRFEKKGQQVIITDKKTNQKSPLVFFHFHGLKFFSDGLVSYSGPLYEMDNEVKTVLYIPYVKRLLQLEKQLKEEGVSFNTSGAKHPSPEKFKIMIEYAKMLGILLLKRKASLFKSKNYNFKYHYHFYKIDQFEVQHGALDRS